MESAARISAYNCSVCEGRDFTVFDAFGALPRITSDCRPFRKGGELLLCHSCGAVQKRVSETWVAEIGEIYSNYFAYYQAGGEEQVVFDARSAEVRPRSEVLLERLTEMSRLPLDGAALDIGCGTGVTLSAMARLLPGYRLHGQDLDRRSDARLRAISNFVELYTCNPAEISGRFELITLIHSLEHFPAPLDVLKAVHDRLRERGVLLIEVCDVERNPFDMLIADHLMHFTTHTLRRIVEKAGFHVSTMATDWVGKELSCVAQRAGGAWRNSDVVYDVAAVTELVSRNLDWLEQMILTNKAAVERYGKIGIFGTSIAGTWLAGSIAGGYDFFVDEDPNRIGRRHLGKPILSPEQAPEGCAVLLALVPTVARIVGERLKQLPVVFVEPPPLG